MSLVIVNNTNAADFPEIQAPAVRPGRRSGRGSKRKKARQWTCLVESLKTSTDYLYDFCQREHSADGCKEILMYLSNSIHDFEELMKTLRVESEWEEENQKRANDMEARSPCPGVAWEIRKAMSSPSHALKEQISVVDLNNSMLPKRWDASAPIAESGDGWQVVTRRKRGSVSSVTSMDEPDPVLLIQQIEEQDKPVTPQKMTVYDRLYSSAVRAVPAIQAAPVSVSSPSSTSLGALSKNVTTSATSGRYMCPRSAMDLPQTKASMAKIAYSRQKLWQQRAETTLADKLKARQKACRREEYERRSQSRCGMSDSSASDSGQGKRSGTNKQNIGVSAEVRSLGSIREQQEGDDLDAVPADPAPSGQAQIAQNVGSNVRSFSLPPDAWQAQNLLDLEGDAEWREMTEEEESLAFEERSLTREIENEERMSIDAELERQVAQEAELLEIAHPTLEVDRPSEAPSEISEVSYTEALNLWELDMKQFASMSWCEIVEREFAGNFRQPGEEAAKHEKLSSPHRKRCETSDGERHKKHEQKIQHAEELRQQLLLAKAKRLKELSNKISEIRARQAEIEERKRAHMMIKMEKADENRSRTLANIVNKAKEDDQKVLEVHFVNTVEQGLLMQDKLEKDRAKEKEIEKRKGHMESERQRKMTEKAAKEQAVEDRRRQAEMERVARLQEKVEVKQARTAQFDAQKEEHERERRQKRRMREERIESFKDGKKEKIRQKQIKFESSVKRHEQSVEAVRAKAQQLIRPKAYSRWTALSDVSAWPSQTSSKVATCTRCNVMLHSELEVMAHVVGASHLEKWKTKAVDVTHHKLAMEMCEVIVESDSNCASLTTSIVEEAPAPPAADLTKRRQKLKVKMTQRVKKCWTNLQSSNSYKSASANNSQTSRQTRELPSLLSQADCRAAEHALIELSTKINDKSTAAKDQLVTCGVLHALIDKLMQVDAITERLRSRILAIVNTLAASHKLSALTLLAATQALWYIADQMSKAVLMENIDWSLLEELLRLFVSSCSTVSSVSLANYGIDPNELKNRMELFVEVLSLIGFQKSVPRVLESVFQGGKNGNNDVDVASLRLVLNFANHLANNCQMASEDGLVVAVTECLLLLLVDFLRDNTKNVKESPAADELRTSVCTVVINFFANIPCQHFQVCFERDATRSFRFLLLLSESVRAAKDTYKTEVDPWNVSLLSKEVKCEKVSPELARLKIMGISMAGRFASLSASHQLLCLLGSDNSLLSVLTLSPIRYLTSPTLSPLFTSAIIRICLNSPSAKETLKQHISTKWITMFIKHATESPNSLHSVCLQKVLPHSDWSSALLFFEGAEEK